MSGAVIAAAVALGTQSGGGSGGSDVTPDAISFTNIAGQASAFSNSQTINGINAVITLEFDYTGSGFLYAYVNGTPNSGASGMQVAISNSQTLLLAIFNFTGSIVTGTITIKNVSDSNTTLTTLTYSVGPNNFD